FALALFAINSLSAAVPPQDHLTNRWDRELSAQMARAFQNLPPVAAHYPTLTPDEAERRLRQDSNYTQIVREKLEGHWFGALVETSGKAPFAIAARFETWRGLMDFLVQQNALVDIWALGEAPDAQPRRIPAPELAELQRQPRERPTFVTVTYSDGAKGKVVTYRLEFGFQAASFALAALEAYQKHRHLQLVAHEILSAQN